MSAIATNPMLELGVEPPPGEGRSTRRALLCLGVQKSFGDSRVVRDLSLSVSEGEILALLGSSGCGKTTTLRLIAGLEQVDGGCIEIDGDLVAGAGMHRPPERRRIGMVFQDYALFPHLTVRGNVGFGLGRGRSVRRRIDEVLDLVGLAGFGDRVPQELSGGQQQRVALARALAPKPRVLLMDEPFSNLDPDLRTSVRREVRDILREAEATAVLVTHDQEEALSMADQVALMMSGMIEQRATPEDLYRMPASRKVATFIGESFFLQGFARDHEVETEIGPLVLHDRHSGKVDVVVRPESIMLTPCGIGETSSATVVQREYFGRYQTLTVQLRSSGELLRVTEGPDTTVAAGDEVCLAARHPLVAFPVEPSE